MGSIVCAVLPIVFLKFLFLRRFFSLSKEKKRQRRIPYAKYGFNSSSMAAAKAANFASASASEAPRTPE